MVDKFQHCLHKKHLGDWGERLVESFYGKQGFSVRERNYRCGRAEVDLIMEKEDLVVFIEVKTRSASEYGQPESFVSQMQQDRILDASHHYLESTNWHGRIRFDIVAVTLQEGKTQSIEVFEDAFF